MIMWLWQNNGDMCGCVMVGTATRCFLKFLSVFCSFIVEIIRQKLAARNRIVVLAFALSSYVTSPSTTLFAVHVCF